MQAHRFATTKIQPPRRRSTLLARPALDDALAAQLHDARIVLLQAPAGFGKTTALAAQLARLPAGTALMSVDRRRRRRSAAPVRLPGRGARALRPAVAHRARSAGVPVPADRETGAAATHAAPTPLAALSAREREVLDGIAVGASNKHIARALDISPHTVKRHVANILDKLALASRGQASAWLRDAATG